MKLIVTELPKLIKASAFTVWPFVFITPEAKNNQKIIRHEAYHLSDQRRAGVVPWLLAYLILRPFYSAFDHPLEVQAYLAEEKK